MEYQVPYEGMEQRNSFCKGATENGSRMLHDDFDKGWKRGDDPRGKLTFTDVLPPQAQPVIIRDYGAEIDTIKARLIELGVR